MRVAIVTREFPPEVYGGAGVHAEYLAAELDRAEGVDVEVHAFGEPRPSPLVVGTYQPWDALVDPSRPQSAALGTVSADLAIAGALDGVDLVHTHTWYANLAGHLAAMMYDIPHVVTAHSLEPLRPWKAEQLGGGYAVSSWCERTSFEAAAAIIAVSGGMRDDILRVYPGLDPDRVHVIHNGIDTDTYRPVPAGPVLARYGIDPDRPYVLFVGRITRQKGVTHLVDAIPHLRPDTQVVLCAGAPDTPAIGAEMEAKVAAARERHGGVVWIDDMVERADVVALMSGATVFACPSVYEPFGLINVEAMACGTPVVASRTGGIPEIVVEGETGHLVELERGDDPYGEPADPARFVAELAEAINDLLDRPDDARRMGEAGRRRVLDGFAWPEVATRTVDLYRSVIG
ncbi:MAG TPA: glycogen synthase [Acidimicrobiales bacterium]|nr:glycogen synthase [Acidimicrobiales bacterium]